MNFSSILDFLSIWRKKKTSIWIRQYSRLDISWQNNVSPCDIKSNIKRYKMLRQQFNPFTQLIWNKLLIESTIVGSCVWSWSWWTFNSVNLYPLQAAKTTCIHSGEGVDLPTGKNAEFDCFWFVFTTILLAQHHYHRNCALKLSKWRG